MKQSKTTLKELTHRYRAVLLKCALLNLAAFAVALPAKAEDLVIDANSSKIINKTDTCSGGSCGGSYNKLNMTGGEFKIDRLNTDNDSVGFYFSDASTISGGKLTLSTPIQNNGANSRVIDLNFINGLTVAGTDTVLDLSGHSRIRVDNQFNVTDATIYVRDAFQDEPIDGTGTINFTNVKTIVSNASFSPWDSGLSSDVTITDAEYNALPENQKAQYVKEQSWQNFYYKILKDPLTGKYFSAEDAKKYRLYEEIYHRAGNFTINGGTLSVSKGSFATDRNIITDGTEISLSNASYMAVAGEDEYSDGSLFNQELTFKGNSTVKVSGGSYIFTGHMYLPYQEADDYYLDNGLLTEAEMAKSAKPNEANADINIQDSTIITLNDTSAIALLDKNSGKINMTGGKINMNDSSSIYGALVVNGGELNVNGNNSIKNNLYITGNWGTDIYNGMGSILFWEAEGTAPAINLQSGAINLNGTLTADINATGGTISFNNNSALNGKITGQLNKLTIAGGTFNDENNLVIDGSEDITVSGGTIISNNRGAVLQHQGTGNIVVTGGTFNNNTDHEANDIVHLGSGDIKISGGTFNNSVIYKPVSCANGYGYETCSGSSTTPAAGKIEISGGVFNNAELNSDSADGLRITGGTLNDTSVAAASGLLSIADGTFKDTEFTGVGIDVTSGKFGGYISFDEGASGINLSGGDFSNVSRFEAEGMKLNIDSDKADLTLKAGKIHHSIEVASKLTITGSKVISVAKSVVKSAEITGKITAGKDSFVGGFDGSIDKWNVENQTAYSIWLNDFQRDVTLNSAYITLNDNALAGTGDLIYEVTAFNGNIDDSTSDTVKLNAGKILTDAEINESVKLVLAELKRVDTTSKNSDDLKYFADDVIETSNSSSAALENYIYNQWNQENSLDFDKVEQMLRQAYTNYNNSVGTDSAQVNIAKSEITMNGTSALINGTANNGNIVVSDNSTVVANGTNEISAKSGTVSFKDSKLVVSDKANLTVATKDGNRLNLTNSTVDLSGTLNGNLNGGTLAFNSANARLSGAIYGAVDIKFNDDFTLSKSTVTGEIADLGDVIVSEGKHLTARLETFGKNLPDDDLNMKSFVMGKNAKLTLTGNASLEAEDLDIEASDKVYLTGQINVNNAGVKLGNIAHADVSPTGTYAIENATLSTTGNLTEFAARSNEDMVVKNSILNFGSQYTYFAKDGGTSGDVVLEATKVTTSGGLYLENEIGGNIRFTNGSTISLNASDNLIIGNEKNHSGKGSIIADNSSLVLNGTKVFVGQEADDALKLQNKASMTANGTVSVKTINGKTGLISVADSSLNIGGTLEGNVSFIGNGTLNLSGVLNGDMNIANTAEISSSADAFSKIRGTITNNGTVSLTGGTLGQTLSGKIKIAGNTAFGGSFTTNDITISAGKTLDIGKNSLTASTIKDGTISAILTDAAKNTAIVTAKASNVTLKLDMSQASRDDVTEYKITNGTGFTFGDYATNRYAVADFEFDKNNAKTLEKLSGWNGGNLWILRLATASEAAIEDLEKSGVVLPENEKNASKILDLASGILDKLPEHHKKVIDKVNDLLDKAQGKAEEIKQILREIAPDASTSGSKTASNTAKSVINVINSRFGGGSPRRGRSGGDYTVGQTAVWAQGMMNYAKLDTDNGFNAHSNGFASGFEVNFTDSFKAGLGYAYTSTDISTERSKTDVKTHTGFVYGEYKPNKAYINGVVSFGRSDYDDTTRSLSLNSAYKTDTIAAQIAAGYKAGVLTPEAAVRFTNVKQKAYTDATGAKMEEKTADTWTGVLGAKIDKNYVLRANRKIGLSPELKVAATYDFARDDENRTVTLPDGSSYTATGEAMERFGVEAGAGVTVSIANSAEIALTYDGKFKKDYQDHTGMVNLKIKF